MGYGIPLRGTRSRRSSRLCLDGTPNLGTAPGFRAMRHGIDELGREDENSQARRARQGVTGIAGLAQGPRELAPCTACFRGRAGRAG